MRTALIFSLFLIGIGNSFAWDGMSSNVEIIVDGHSIPKYFHDGTTYIEALKGKRYSIRLANPLGERVAVALSVDGLNTIDAKHTEARKASKWILDPYESIVISGWQINDKQARQFYFTTEENSYGAKLGKTENLGVISAVFFRERRPQVYRRAYPPPPPLYPPYPPYPRPLGGMGAAGGMGGFGGGAAEGSAGAMGGAGMGGGMGGGMGSPGILAPESSRDAKSRIETPDSSRPKEPDYAATGMGGKTNHEVERVYLDLEDMPFATMDVRYEFRSALLRLGVFPPPPPPPPRDTLSRRERAKGFSDGEYCPEP
jgi:hypothetical protein